MSNPSFSFLNSVSCYFFYNIIITSAPWLRLQAPSSLQQLIHRLHPIIRKRKQQQRKSQRLAPQHALRPVPRQLSHVSHTYARTRNDATGSETSPSYAQRKLFYAAVALSPGKRVVATSSKGYAAGCE